MPDLQPGTVEDLAARLSASQDELREAQERAQKIPALESEIERLKAANEKVGEKAKVQASENAELDQKVFELESEIRAQDELEAQVAEAKSECDNALNEKDKLNEHVKELETHVSELNSHRLELVNEVQRLKVHEVHTQKLAEVLGLTQEIV
jgi:chromosome segregation ATPase